MRGRIVVPILSIFVALTTSAPAQQCEDFNQCTVKEMCSEGICTGTPSEGGSCDDGNDCTVDDRCVLEETAFGGAICRGDPVEEGSA